MAEQSASTTSRGILAHPAASLQVIPRDTWYGVEDPAERRRRQNRLNQRIHRQRKRSKIDDRNLNNDDHDQRDRHHINPTAQPTRDSVSCTAVYQQHAHWLTHPSPERRGILLRQLAEYHNSLLMNSPQASHLLTLTRVNVHRAFVANMASLGIPWELIIDDDAISPFTMLRPPDPTTTTARTPFFPGSLHPTSLQQSRVHHAWLDLFPCPVMRDNLLTRGSGDWDDEELCTDIMGFWEGNATGPNSLIVWGEPSDPRNWEVTEGFMRKWGWVVEGCEEVMRATDSWRVGRGDEPMFRSRGLYQWYLYLN